MNKKFKSIFLIPSFMIGIFLLGTDNLVISPLLNLIAKDTSSSISNISLGITLYSVAYGVFAILLAPISDIFGRKPIVIISSFLFGITSIGISIFHTESAFFIFRFLSGVFAAVLGPNLWAYSNENFKEGLRELIISWMMSAFGVSTVFGIPIGMVIAGVFGWSRMFLYIGIICIVLSFLFLISGTPTHANNFSFKTHFKNIGKAFTMNWCLAFSMLFLSSAYLCIYPFISYWLENIHKWTNSETTVAFFAIGITGLIGSILCGMFLQKLDSKLVVRYSWICQLAIVFIMLIFTLIFNSPILFIIMLSIWTFLQNMGNTAFIASISSNAGDIRGSVMALNNSSIFLGFTLGSFFGGITWNINGTLAFNLLVSLISCIISISFLILHTKRKSASMLHTS